MLQSNVCPFKWNPNTKKLSILDQLALPENERYIELNTVNDYVRAITDMIVRGAPAIGITAAFGLATSASLHWHDNDKLTAIEADKNRLAQTRPTAVNLFWALERMAKVLALHIDDDTPYALFGEALDIWLEDLKMNKKMAIQGADAIGSIQNILTHCNAGALATGGVGTALGVIRELHARQKNSNPIHVWVDETRPYLQGARLTAWELLKDKIDCTLITDNMAAHLMKQKLVDAVIVGADRIALNFDIANKIGTYALAVLAQYHHIPFYVAAPDSTFDPILKNGDQIVIEERAESEVTSIKDMRIAPQNIKARHPAFDVTPHQLITAIITPNKVIRPNRDGV